MAALVDSGRPRVRVTATAVRAGHGQGSARRGPRRAPARGPARENGDNGLEARDIRDLEGAVFPCKF